MHPNHVWQIDASLCVLFYLPVSGKDTGLRMMNADEFYKNKPKNVVKIEQDRVWRYVVTDHCSGCLFVWYVFGGENSENLCETFIQAMQPKAERLQDPFCGVPVNVMLDPGSANTGHGFKHLNKQLGVNVIINKVGNPRAKGQVENGNNLVETQFESRLKLVRINSIEQLQGLANRWMRYFNGQKIHSRHGMSRYKAWQKIMPEQLIIPPPTEYCRELVLSKPEERKVNPDLTIDFGGRKYDVRNVPFVLVGESGAGKSTLREDLQDRINREGRQVVVIEPYVLAMEDNDQKGKTLKAVHIAEAILEAVSPNTSPKRSPEARFRQIHKALADSAKAGNKHVLVIEEAHCLPIPTLKHLKRFFELKNGFERLIGIVLIGQTELGQKLSENNPNVREVVQRCEVVTLLPLTDGKLQGYLKHKFERVGVNVADVLTDNAIDAIAARLTVTSRNKNQLQQQSLLYPLAVNNLVSAAMNEAASLGFAKVDADIVKGI
ncbi:type II secretory pathway, component ExeA [Kingella kingae ATCC 23330]|uniref:Type II secretory pathway, component ExeA n=2 Tax=Kingella kingae TaxID=504 RepID=F5S4B4_KINKI|nr:type II secretory pathway, component ExeA [Kingella kingae ATCC 23330]